MTLYYHPGIFAHMFSAGDLVFDVGACVGNFTAWFRTRGARVVAVEPEARNIVKLRERFADDPGVTIVNKAVGQEEGRGKLAVNEGSETISSLVHEQFWGPESPFAGVPVSWVQDVEMTTLDALIAEYGRPQFAKIDTEGYEKWVLAGLSKPIPFVQFEFGYVVIREGWSRQAIERVLSIAPHARFNYTDDESNSFELGEAERMQDRLNDWYPAEVVLRDMDEKLSKLPDFWGNLFANMTEDCDG